MASASTSAPAHRTRTLWAAGASTFAATVMIVVGTLPVRRGPRHRGQRLEVPRARTNYVFTFNATAWGWFHMIIGLGAAVAGGFIFTGNIFARSVGIALAGALGDRELHVAAALPDLGDRPHRPRRRRHLGPVHRGPRRGLRRPQARKSIDGPARARVRHVSSPAWDRQRLAMTRTKTSAASPTIAVVAAVRASVGAGTPRAGTTAPACTRRLPSR